MTAEVITTQKSWPPGTYLVVRRGQNGWFAVVACQVEVLTAAQLPTRAEAFQVAMRKAAREDLPMLFEARA